MKFIMFWFYCGVVGLFLDILFTYLMILFSVGHTKGVLFRLAIGLLFPWRWLVTIAMGPIAIYDSICYFIATSIQINRLGVAKTIEHYENELPKL